MTRVLEMYGFIMLPRDEAIKLGLPSGSGSFEELFHNMNKETKNKPSKLKDYGTSHLMRDYEKEISFLNRFFVYKKIRNVDTERVELDLEEYRHKQLNMGGLEKEKDSVRKKNSNVKRLGSKLILKRAKDVDVTEKEKEKEKEQEMDLELIPDVGVKKLTDLEKAVVEPVLENTDTAVNTDALNVISNAVDALPIPIKKKRLTLKKRLGN